MVRLRLKVMLVDISCSSKIKQIAKQHKDNSHVIFFLDVIIRSILLKFEQTTSFVRMSKTKIRTNEYITQRDGYIYYSPHSEGMGTVLFSQVSVCSHPGWVPPFSPDGGWVGIPPSPETEQHSEYLLRSRWYASYIHAGELSCRDVYSFRLANISKDILQN